MFLDDGDNQIETFGANFQALGVGQAPTVAGKHDHVRLADGGHERDFFRHKRLDLGVVLALVEAVNDASGHPPDHATVEAMAGENRQFLDADELDGIESEILSGGGEILERNVAVAPFTGGMFVFAHERLGWGGSCDATSGREAAKAEPVARFLRTERRVIGLLTTGNCYASEGDASMAFGKRSVCPNAGLTLTHTKKPGKRGSFDHGLLF